MIWKIAKLWKFFAVGYNIWHTKIHLLRELSTAYRNANNVHSSGTCRVILGANAVSVIRNVCWFIGRVSKLSGIISVMSSRAHRRPTYVGIIDGDCNISAHPSTTRCASLGWHIRRRREKRSADNSSLSADVRLFT